ncbi:hypothetical protein HELA111659_06485 [Helicobacter labetoulli]
MKTIWYDKLFKERYIRRNKAALLYVLDYMGGGDLFVL